MPQSYTIIDPQSWTQNSRENEPSIGAPFKLSRIPCLHPTDPPQPATLHVHQPPIIHIDFTLQVPEPCECNESALRVEGDEVVWLCRKLNDRVAALVEDGCFGGHETIAYSEFLRGRVPGKIVNRAFLVCGGVRATEKRVNGQLTENNPSIVITSSGNEVHPCFSVVALVALIDIGVGHAQKHRPVCIPFDMYAVRLEERLLGGVGARAKRQQGQHADDCGCAFAFWHERGDVRIFAARGEEDACAVFDAELGGGCRVPRLVLSRVEDLDIARETDGIGFVGGVLDVPESLIRSRSGGRDDDDLPCIRGALRE